MAQNQAEMIIGRIDEIIWSLKKAKRMVKIYGCEAEPYEFLENLGNAQRDLNRMIDEET